MNRDWMFGVARAGALALYPNVIAAALFLNGLNDLGSKCWLIFFSTVGPALLGPGLFGVRTKRPRDSAPQRLAPGGKWLFGLAISGLFAAAYFLAIVGLGDDQQGLGAGLAEMIDSRFFPGRMSPGCGSAESVQTAKRPLGARRWPQSSGQSSSAILQCKPLTKIVYLPDEEACTFPKRWSERGLLNPIKGLAIATRLRPICELARLTSDAVEETPRRMLWQVYASIPRRLARSRSGPKWRNGLMKTAPEGFTGKPLLRNS
jgi:hypothetical protein